MFFVWRQSVLFGTAAFDISPSVFKWMTAYLYELWISIFMLPTGECGFDFAAFLSDTSPEHIANIQTILPGSPCSKVTGSPQAMGYVYIYICIYIYIHIYIQSLFMNFCIYVNASIFMYVYSCIYSYTSYHSNKFFKHYKRSITWPEFTNLTWMHYSTLFAFP